MNTNPAESSSPSLQVVDQLIDQHLPNLMGWCSPDKGKRMARLVAGYAAPRPFLGVELGVFGGRGVVAMALAVKHCLGERGVVDGIDPYTPAAALEGTQEAPNHEWWASLDYAKVLESAREAIARLGLYSVTSLKIRRSQDIVGSYANSTIDLLHQDSNHSPEISCYEVETWTPKMRPGAYWVMDDTNWTSTERAQAMLKERFTLAQQFDSWAIYRVPG